MMQCLECISQFVRSECEELFASKVCGACRRASLHPNALVEPERSLWALAPTVAHRWSKDRNRHLLPEDVGAKSQRCYWFNCSDCSAVFQSSPGNAARNPKVMRCNNCATGLRGSKNSTPRGESVASVPELLAIWDFDRNTVDPAAVAHRSNKSFYWLCEFGHSTQTTVDNKAVGKGCRVCLERFFVSNPERELQRLLIDLAPGSFRFNNRTLIAPYELDATSEELKLAIEFNGSYYHSEAMIQRKHGISAEAYHTMKLELTKSKGFDLLFVWEKDWRKQREQVVAQVRSALESTSIQPADLSLLRKLTESADSPIEP